MISIIIHIHTKRGNEAATSYADATTKEAAMDKALQQVAHYAAQGFRVTADLYEHFVKYDSILSEEIPA